MKQTRESAEKMRQDALERLMFVMREYHQCGIPINLDAISAIEKFNAAERQMEKEK